MDDVIAKKILSRTGNEKFNAVGIRLDGPIVKFKMIQECPACGIAHKELPAWVDKEHRDWGWYVKCPLTDCRIWMTRKIGIKE